MKGWEGLRGGEGCEDRGRATLCVRHYNDTLVSLLHDDVAVWMVHIVPWKWNAICWVTIR